MVLPCNRPEAEEQETHVCPICDQPVRDEGEGGCAQDALLCEGDCQCWQHRWCAGVSKERYATLSSSEDPFLCSSCTIAGQQAAITGQQADIACLRECLNALCDEVKALKATVAVLQIQTEPNTSKDGVRAQTAVEQSTYASVVKPPNRDKRSNGRRKYQPVERPDKTHAIANAPKDGQTTPGKTGPALPTPESGDAAVTGKRKVRVVGARRIWGTMKDSTVKSVKNVISVFARLMEGCV